MFVAIQALDLYKIPRSQWACQNALYPLVAVGVNLQGGYCDVTMKERTGLFASLTEGAGAHDSIVVLPSLRGQTSTWQASSATLDEVSDSVQIRAPCRRFYHPH